MSTQAQLDANASNARLSTGPRSEEGKAISSHNNLRHGFRSQSVLFPGDDPAAYDSLLAELTGHFSPEDLTEDRFVREMADAEWRLRRVRESLESALTRRVSDLTPLHPAVSPIHLQSLAIETLAETGTSYGTWLRYETKFERQYDRAYKDWKRYQNDRRSVSAKEADIWMKRAVYAPPPGAASPIASAEGHHASVQFRKLASSVQNASQHVPSAQDATRASVVRDQKTPSSVQTPRSAPCPCGSGEKYKRCCGRSAPPVLNNPLSEAA